MLSNTFFSFGGNVSRQLMGIPMGIQPAPLIANLFLASYEFEFFQKLLAAAPRAPPTPPAPATASAPGAARAFTAGLPGVAGRSGYAAFLPLH